MKTLGIVDFLPKYPNLVNEKHDILNPYDDDFYKNIYEKKEFYDEKLESVEPFPQNIGEMMKHQKLIAKFLSSYTPYNGILLMHQMGTGKTCSSVAAVEQIKREKNGFTGALIFARGDGLLNNYTDEIIFKCTPGDYIPENYDSLTELEKTHRKRKNVGKWYDMHTFEIFAKEIKRATNVVLKERYNNKVIVIDEVHNLRLQDATTDLAIYEQFHRFLHVVENCKIILMSGTPMKDGPEEIASVMNLILPMDKQLPTKDAFLLRYMSEINGVQSLRLDNLHELREAFHGRVSYLRAMQSETKKVLRGKTMEGLNYFKLVDDTMSNFQTDYYNEAYQIDSRERGVYTNSRQASLFVYPDGSYGSKGFTKYIKKTTSRRMIEDGKNKQVYTYTMNKELIDAVTGNTDEETIEKISKYSSTYGATLKRILESYDNKKSSFVYCEFVHGSGVILFSKLLGLLGFSKASGKEKEGNVSKRYGLITNATATKKELSTIINRFNKPDNMHGQIINVIIGSRVIGEGFSLKNVQDEDILTPHWNYSETDQAIARGFRLGSHIDLINSGITPVLNVFQRVSLANDGTRSIDLSMYILSESKDITMKLIERQIKEMDVFCALTYNRNHVTGYDGQRECDYMECDYGCEGIVNYEPTKLDKSTYNLYYIENDIKKIIDMVIEIYKDNFTLDFTSIQKKIPEYSQYQIISAMRKIILENMVIYDKYGFPSYLREDNNIYFLTNSLVVENNFTLGYYTQNPVSVLKISFVDEIEMLSNKSIITSIQTMCSMGVDIHKKINNLPLKIQEMFLEASITAYLAGIETPVRDSILEHYKSFYVEIEEVWISWLLKTDTGIVRCLQNGEWGSCSDRYISKMNEHTSAGKKNMETNVYGYYGIVNPSTDEFCIRDVASDTVNVDKRKNKRGKRCGNWDKMGLMKIIIENLGIPPPESYMASTSSDSLIKMIKANKHLKFIDNYESMDTYDLRRSLYWSTMNVNALCSSIRKWFEEHDMISEEFTCGSRPTKQ
jgi:superfamily II DNA or RNA helicase